MALVYGNPVTGVYTEFQQVGNTKLVVLVFAFTTCSFVLLQILGLLFILCLSFKELRSKPTDAHHLDPRTPRRLKCTICLCTYLFEFVSICCQTWLFLDINVETLTTDFQIHLRREYIMIFSVSMVGSILNILFSKVALNCASNLQETVNE